MGKSYLFGVIPIDTDESLGKESERFRLFTLLMFPTMVVGAVNGVLALVVSEVVPYVLGKLLGAVTGSDE